MNKFTIDPEAKTAEQERRQDAIVVLFVVPVAIATIIGLAVSWFVAMRGAKYRTVRLATMPIGFLWGNILMFMPCFLIFAIAVMRGSKVEFSLLTDLFMYESVLLRGIVFPFWSFVMNENFALDPWVLNPNGTDPMMIICFQVMTWFLMGRWINRNIAMGMYDYATIRLAERQGIDPDVYRLERAQNDKAYLKTSLWYEKRNAFPMMGMGPGAAGYNPITFYN